MNLVRSWLALVLCGGGISLFGCTPPPEPPASLPSDNETAPADPLDEALLPPPLVPPIEPADQPGDAPADAPADALGEQPHDQPANEPADPPANAPAEQPVGAAEASAASRETILLGTPELTAGIPGEGPLTLDAIRAWLADPKNHVVLDPVLPLGLDEGQDQIVGLEQNPLTRAKIELGRQLYFDTRLSIDNTVSCATCHDPDEGYARNTRFGIGIQDLEGDRNSPVAFNRILSAEQFWDGRAATLEEQAIGPIENPVEMGFTHEGCIARLKEAPGYVMQFEAIFGEEGVTIENVGKAIASFERAIVTGPAPYDYYHIRKQFEDAMTAEQIEALKDTDPRQYARYQQAKAGNEAQPLSESAQRGYAIYFSNRGMCAECHGGPNLTDEKYHNLGVGMDAEEPDLGRFLVTGKDEDRGAFKTPTVRNIAQTAPYMHDGSLETLEEVVALYSEGGHPNEYLSELIFELALSERNQADLVEFMKACTGPLPPVERGRLPE